MCYMKKLLYLFQVLLLSFPAFAKILDSETIIGKEPYPNSAKIDFNNDGLDDWYSIDRNQTLLIFGTQTGPSDIRFNIRTAITIPLEFISGPFHVKPFFTNMDNSPTEKIAILETEKIHIIEFQEVNLIDVRNNYSISSLNVNLPDDFQIIDFAIDSFFETNQSLDMVVGVQSDISTNLYVFQNILANQSTLVQVNEIYDIPFIKSRIFSGEIDGINANDIIYQGSDNLWHILLSIPDGGFSPSNPQYSFNIHTPDDILNITNVVFRNDRNDVLLIGVHTSDNSDVAFASFENQIVENFSIPDFSNPLFITIDDKQQFGQFSKVFLRETTESISQAILAIGGSSSKEEARENDNFAFYQIDPENLENPLFLQQFKINLPNLFAIELSDIGDFNGDNISDALFSTFDPEPSGTEQFTGGSTTAFQGIKKTFIPKSLLYDN